MNKWMNWSFWLFQCHIKPSSIWEKWAKGWNFPVIWAAVEPPIYSHKYSMLHLDHTLTWAGVKPPTYWSVVQHATSGPNMLSWAEVKLPTYWSAVQHATSGPHMESPDSVCNMLGKFHKILILYFNHFCWIILELSHPEISYKNDRFRCVLL
jgi:hypothetical protein